MATIKKPAKKMQMGGKAKPVKVSRLKKIADSLNNEGSQKMQAAMNRTTGKYGQAKGFDDISQALSKSASSDLDRSERYNKLIKNATDKSKMKKQKNGGVTKAKSGKSFPDLNKDDKITKADILKGRGVIAKKGAKVKKAMMGDAVKSSPMMKSGGKMKKCKYGCK
jgi:hypothetical protein